MQLPTRGGKTLAGPLRANGFHARIRLPRKNQEPMVYLCPTKQLVSQMIEPAEERYSLTVHGFTGGSAISIQPIRRNIAMPTESQSTNSGLFDRTFSFDDA